MVSTNTELHWTLYISRLILKSIIKNCENEKEIESIISFCDNFNFNDNDSIAENCTLGIDIDELKQIDFLSYVPVDVWVNKNGDKACFIDCVAQIWNLEKKSISTKDESLCYYFDNCMISSILVNLKNYTQSKHEIDSAIYATMIWTIQENRIELTNSVILKSVYGVDDEYLLAVGSMVFCMEKILGGSLDEKFNSETDDACNDFHGYRNDYILISEEILDRDIFIE